LPSGTSNSDYLRWQNGAWVVSGTNVALGTNASNGGGGSVAIGSNAVSFNQTPGTFGVAVGAAAGANNFGDSVAIGFQAGQNSQQTMAVALGHFAGNVTQSEGAIAIGASAGFTTQGVATVACGYQAGASNQGNYAIAIGSSAGYCAQASSAIAIGACAGFTTQGLAAVAYGFQSGGSNQGNYAIAIGSSAGYCAQGPSAVAIGVSAGFVSQATNSICIGALAGASAAGAVVVGYNSQLAGTTSGIFINGTNATQSINPGTTAGCFLRPVRSLNGLGSLQPLTYNETTSEVISGTSTAQTITTNGQTLNLTNETFLRDNLLYTSAALPADPLYVGQIIRIINPFPTPNSVSISAPNGIVGSSGTIGSISVTGGVMLMIGFRIGGGAPNWTYLKL
jgi:hypothetical protein